MPVTVTVPDEALELMKPLFSQVEGSCEVWTDDEVVTRMLIRGVMAYGQTAGRPFEDITAVAAELRGRISAG